MVDTLKVALGNFAYQREKRDGMVTSSRGLDDLNLGIGQTEECFQSMGRTPAEWEELKMRERGS